MNHQHCTHRDRRINTIPFAVGRSRLSGPQQIALRHLADAGGSITFREWLDADRPIRDSTLSALWGRGLCRYMPSQEIGDGDARWEITPKGCAALEAL